MKGVRSMNRSARSTGDREKEVVFSLRIDKEAYETVRSIAKDEDRSINTQLMRFIRAGISSYQPSQQ